MAQRMSSATTPYTAAFRRLRGTFIAVALFSAVVNVLMLTGPMFMLQVYDRVLSSGSVPTLQALYLIVVVLFIFLAVYDFLRNRVMSRAAYRLDQSVSGAAYDLWMRSALADQQQVTRPLSDLATVRGFLSSPAMLGFFDLPWIPLYLAVTFLVHPWLGWATVAGLCVVLVLALLNQWSSRAWLARAMQMDAIEAFFIDQSRRTAEAVLPMGMGPGVAGRWADMHRKGLATGQVGGDRSQGFTAASKAFRLLLQSTLLGLGGYLALGQEISAGMIVATSIIAGRALAPVDQVIGQWANVVRAREAHRRLKDSFAAQAAARPVIDLPPAKGHLTVGGVTKYVPGDRARERAPILENVRFALEPGDALGVIGPSASGKSTLARILVGATVPDEGNVRLDGATLDQWSETALGRQIGYLPQKLELLSGSIRDNIARFDPDASDEDVIDAARIAGVHDMILQLPDGYATQILLDSATLSGGQLQRIGLARAVFGTPRYIVLDEPNSNLDAAGDDALSSAILAMREKGSTVVVMAHRPSAIASVNKVLVLHGGRVGEFGDKDSVLKKTMRPRAVGHAAGAGMSSDPILRTSIRWPGFIGAAAAVLLLGGGTYWAAQTSIAGAVIAAGNVEVVGRPKSVQHLDGGIIAELPAREGASVAQGDVLVRLDDTTLRANLRIYRARLSEALALQDRLIAEQAEAPQIRFSDPDPLIDPGTAALHNAGQAEIFEARRALEIGRMARLAEKVDQFGNQIAGVEALIAAKEQQLRYIAEEIAAVQELTDKGLARASQLRSLQRSEAELLGQIAEHRSELARIRNSIRDTEIERLQGRRQIKEEVVTELRDTMTNIEEMRQQIISTAAQLDRVEIRAPNEGRVHEMQFTTIGGVVPPGGVILQIIPESEGFAFQTRVDPSAIDQVFVGQPAKVRFPAFNQRTTPELTGRVKDMSATTSVDEVSGMSFYRVELAVTAQELARLGDQDLIPGMPVEAYLTTANRTVLSYLTKPLTDQLAQAFREE